MKRIRIQVTCECTAYNFPHRIGGGKCYGRVWCESYREIDSNLCDTCNCFNNNSCDVVNGLECFKFGECYLNELHTEEKKSSYGNLPKSLEQIMEIEYSNHYERY